MKGGGSLKKAPTNEFFVGEITEETEFKYNENDIPKSVYEELARCFLPDIIASFESEEGKQEQENWKKENNLS